MPPTRVEGTMAKTRYCSFLIRCWSTSNGDARLLVEHVQSGERIAMPDIGAALGWIATWVFPPYGNVEHPRGTEEDEMASRRPDNIPGSVCCSHCCLAVRSGVYPAARAGRTTSRGTSETWCKEEFDASPPASHR